MVATGVLIVFASSNLHSVSLAATGLSVGKHGGVVALHRMLHDTLNTIKGRSSCVFVVETACHQQAGGAGEKSLPKSSTLVSSPKKRRRTQRIHHRRSHIHQATVYSPTDLHNCIIDLLRRLRWQEKMVKLEGIFAPRPPRFFRDQTDSVFVPELSVDEQCV